MNNFSPLTIAVAQLKRGAHAAGVSGSASRRTLVAQVSNLLRRRLPVGKARELSVHPALRTGRGLEIRDTADWKSALQFVSGAPRLRSADCQSADLRRLGSGARDCQSAATARPARPSERARASQSPTASRQPNKLAASADCQSAIQQAASLRHPLAAIVALALLVTGCTMSPKYSRPAAPIPNEWPAGPAYEKANAVTSAPTALPPALAWETGGKNLLEHACHQSRVDVETCWFFLKAESCTMFSA